MKMEWLSSALQKPDRECILLKKRKGFSAFRAGIKRFFPWLILSAIGLVCLAGFGLYLFFYQPAQPTKQSLSIVPSDTFNLLLTLTDSDSHAPLAFLLMGLDAPNKELTILPLPGSLVTKSGKTLEALFNGSGVTETSAACAAQLGVPVDYHWVQDGSTLAQMVDRYGGVDCTLPVAVSASIPHGAQVQTAAGRQHLNGAKVEAAVCYAAYPGMAERLSTQGVLFQALMQQDCTAQNLDPDTFGRMFDLVRTNFSMNDLLSKKQALCHATSSAGHVRVLLPALQDAPAGTSMPTTADREKIQQAFGKQNRQYGH